jgi:membrane protein implicated in regulation of membrane protease activity
MAVTSWRPGVRKPGSRINARNLIVWLSVGVLVGTEVLGATFAAAWAIGGLLELPSAFQIALYAVALVAAVAVMVPFMRRAAQVDPPFGQGSEGDQ